MDAVAASKPLKKKLPNRAQPEGEFFKAPFDTCLHRAGGFACYLVDHPISESRYKSGLGEQSIV